MTPINVSILHRFVMSEEKMYGKSFIFNSKFIAFFYISYFVWKILDGKTK